MFSAGRIVQSVDWITKAIWKQHRYFTEVLPKLYDHEPTQFDEPWQVTPDDERINDIQIVNDSVVIDMERPF